MSFHDHERVDPGWSQPSADACRIRRASRSTVPHPHRSYYTSADLDPKARLEWLDDLMFAAIEGDPVALDHAADAWHKTRDELGDIALEESRLQYMRRAQSVWHSLRDGTQPSAAQGLRRDRDHFAAGDKGFKVGRASRAERHWCEFRETRLRCVPLLAANRGRRHPWPDHCLLLAAGSRTIASSVKRGSSANWFVASSGTRSIGGFFLRTFGRLAIQ